MSIHLMSLAWGLDIPATDKMVLLALADAANDDGITWIPMKSKRGGKDLTGKCSLSERAIQGAIKRLCESRRLTRDERQGRGVIYCVYPAGDAPPQQMRPAANAQTPAADAPKPSLTVTNKKGVRLPNDFVMPDDWKAWAQQKKNWSAEDVNEEAEQFTDYWQTRASNATYLDWRKTWQVWVRRSNRKPGTAAGTSKPIDMADYHRRLAVLDTRLGRTNDGFSATAPPRPIGEIVKRMNIGG